VETYTREDAAWRAGVSVEALDGLVGMAILAPDADDRFTEGDVRRIGVAYRLEAAGIPLDLLADALRSGDLTLGFMDDAAYGVFSSFTDETFEELSARTGIPMSLLAVVREATGSAAPAPGDRVREDEMAIVPLLEHQMANGYRPFILERNVRVAGDSMRRIAETSGDAWNSEVTGPLLAKGASATQIREALSDVSDGMTELDEQALIAIYRGQQNHVFMANILGGFEAMLARTGRRAKVERPPAMCFLDITGYTHLTQERGDVAAADLASKLARLVERTSVQHGGRAVKWLGEGVMLYFKDPGPGVEAALEMVAGVAAAGLPPAHVGLHAGPVVFQEGDYYGQTVNLASRIAEYARPGEVLVSHEVVEAADGTGATFREIGPVELKGVSGAMRLYAALQGS
jgi:adenylate cyclase